MFRWIRVPSQFEETIAGFLIADWERPAVRLNTTIRDIPKAVKKKTSFLVQAVEEPLLGHYRGLHGPRSHSQPSDSTRTFKAPEVLW
jgi:hypothetical protein